MGGLSLPGSRAQPCARGHARLPARVCAPRSFKSALPKGTKAPRRSIKAAVARRRASEAPRLPRATAANAAADAPPQVVEAVGQVDLDAPLESHPELVRGTLENGLEYVILPNKSPSGRFEAHLQMHVGSIHEEQDELGVAHFVEHVTFLGSSKREALLTLGVRSNAYTDFHHTVFHMSADIKSDMYHMDMLPHVVDALADVAFRARFVRTRIEKERKAVLAEAQMMNTIEYRMDCQLLRYLHEENELGKQFPIGQVDQVKIWDRSKLYGFWQKWYFPANATLFVVGDVSTPSAVRDAVKCIEKSFGSVPAGKNEDGSLKLRRLGLPPVQHAFGVGELRPIECEKPCKVSMFRHPLISNYILSIFSKLPVHPMSTLRHAREQVIYRVLVSTYSRRINARYIDSDEQFHAIDFEIADSSRESSCVVALTVTAEPKHWEQATRVAVQEAQRMQQHGVTATELEQYVSALVSSSAQQAAAMDTMAHSDMLELTMESLTNGLVLNSNQQAHDAMLQVAPTVTLEEVHAFARTFFSFVGDYSREAAAAADAAQNPGKYCDHGPIRTTSIIACVPTFVTKTGEAIEGGISARAGPSISTSGHLDGSDIDVDAVQQPGVDDSDDVMKPPEGSVPFDIDEAKIQAVLAKEHEMTPLQDVVGPDNLISAEEVQELMEIHKPEFVPVLGREDEGAEPPADSAVGVVQRRLSNGCTLNYKVSDNDPSSAGMRICMSGGRAAEVTSGAGPSGVAAMQVGLRTISEGGTMGRFSREEIEMFCLARLINCYIDTDPENNFIDWYFSSDEQGLRGVLQLCHLIITQPTWSEGGFARSKATILSNSRAVMKSMERANHDKILQAVFGPDRRFREPTEEEVDALTMEGCKELLNKYMRPDNIEVSLVGDFDPAVAEAAFLEYMGTIPARPSPLPLPHVPISFNTALSLPERHITWHLSDSDERGVGNVAGVGFRRWGDITGEGPVEPLRARVAPLPPPNTLKNKTDLALAQTLRRAHPLFAPTVLLFLQEIINSRLFMTVRDQLNLTYDVSFEIVQHDRLNASWWCVTVTASPPKIADATQASLQVLRDCRCVNPISHTEVQRTQSTLLARHEAELKDIQYILNLLTHLQAVDVPLKTIDTLRDLPAMMLSITSADVNDAFAQLGLNDGEIYSSIATSGPRTPEPAPALKMQKTGESEKFSAEPHKGRKVSDMMMQALADAMMGQMRGRVWSSDTPPATPATSGTPQDTVSTGTNTPAATSTPGNGASTESATTSSSSSTLSAAAANASAADAAKGVIGGPASGASGGGAAAPGQSPGGDSTGPSSPAS